jgi:predicted glycoside hydrolase/deacetylase ChbG (UPF0249 family)
VAGKYLIVTADDYNTDPERNRGIVQAARQGIVTGVSVLSNIPLHGDALADLRGIFKNRAGVHLNLTRGYPLTDGLKTIVDERGRFFQKNKIWMKALSGRLDLNEIEREFAAQIMRLRDAGVEPDHIDGNNHVHIFPGIAAVTARVARQFKITNVRLPYESYGMHDSLPARGIFKKIFINTVSLRARQIFVNLGLSCNDFFAGIHYPRVADVESICDFIRNLREGTTELMCHPGFRSASGNPFSNDERERELAALTAPRVLGYIKKYGIELISYGAMEMSSAQWKH